MKKIIECVPNYSEGRDRGVIDAIVAAIAAVDGVKVLGGGELTKKLTVKAANDFDAQCAEAHVTVGGCEQAPSTVRFTVDGDTVDAAVAQSLECPADKLEVLLGNIRLYIVREIEFQQEKGTALDTGGPDAGLGKALSGG